MGLEANFSDTPISLGDFQRAMLIWNDHQPFQVVTTFELHCDVEESSLQKAVEEEFRLLDVQYPIVDEKRQTFRYEKRPFSIRVETFDDRGESPEVALQRICKIGINRRLEVNIDPLFRIWILRTKPYPYIGFDWQHWPVDGLSIGDLIRRIVGRCLQLPIPEVMGLRNPHPPDLKPLHKPWFSFSRRLLYFWDSLVELYRGTKAFRPIRDDIPNKTLEPHLFRIPNSFLIGVRKVADHHHATVNDVLNAICIWVLSESFPERLRNDWRREVTMCNIVDFRKVLGTTLTDKFGGFLGFSIFHGPSKAPQNWQDLIPDVRDQAKRIKDLKLFFGSLSALQMQEFAWKILPNRVWRYLIPKLLPITGCLSNMRYPSEWFPSEWSAKVGSIWNIGPLGRILPSIFVLTTAGERVAFSITVEEGSPFADRISRIKELFNAIFESTISNIDINY
jgi:hypothetical protein